MNILFYTPFTGRSRDTESLMIKFKQSGHSVFYLSQHYGENIQNILKENDIEVYNSPKSEKGFNSIKEVSSLIKFCRKKKIDIVFSHLEPSNFIAVLAQYFIKAKVIICRHHVDEVHIRKKDHLLSYKLTYVLAKKIIVVSERAKKFMVDIENINHNKIDVINLSYDFSLYPNLSLDNIKHIKSNYKCDVLLITACRLINDKRPDLSILVTEELLKLGINVKLLILGEGEMYSELDQLIRNKNLNEKCFLLGKRNDILDYLSASDILVNPSIIDSSSVIVKEAGLVNKTAIVCKDVGDCEDYILEGIHGKLVSKNNFVIESVDFISSTYLQKDLWDKMGKALSLQIKNRFSIESNFSKYQKYLD